MSPKKDPQPLKVWRVRVEQTWAAEDTYFVVARSKANALEIAEQAAEDRPMDPDGLPDTRGLDAEALTVATVDDREADYAIDNQDALDADDEGVTVEQMVRRLDTDYRARCETPGTPEFQAIAEAAGQQRLPIRPERSKPQ